MANHPYSPDSLELVGYVPNFLSSMQIVTIYAIFCLVLCLFIAKYCHVKGVDKWIMCWLGFTGITHLVLETYFVFSPKFYATDYPMYLAEVWKEYSKADSRYAFRNSTVVAVEAVLSMVDGSASIYAMYAIAAKKPYTHPLLLTISLVDISMLAIYFMTAWLDGNIYASEPFYFWVYYATLNSLYGVVVPGIIGLRSWVKIVEAFSDKKRK